MVLSLGAGAALAAKTPIIPISGIGSTPMAWEGAISADGGNIYVVYREAGAILLRRSIDTGTTFEPPVTMSEPGTAVSDVSTAAAGGIAHVAWIETAGDGSQQVVYRRSTDGGGTWAAAVGLTPMTTTSIRSSRVFASGVRVFLAYVDVTAQQLLLRRSTNSGATFAGPQVLGAPAGRSISMAFGTQVMYVAWESSGGSVRLRRSTTGGITWRPGVTLGLRGGEHTYTQPWLAAAGSAAILAMTRGGSPYATVVVRRTRDKGTTWETSRRVSPLNYWADSPVIKRTAGRWLIGFSKCNYLDCEFEALVYRTSMDGITWGNQYSLQTSLESRGPAKCRGIAATADGTTWLRG